MQGKFRVRTPGLFLGSVLLRHRKFCTLATFYAYLTLSAEIGVSPTGKWCLHAVCVLNGVLFQKKSSSERGVRVRWVRLWILTDRLSVCGVCWCGNMCGIQELQGEPPWWFVWKQAWGQMSTDKEQYRCLQQNDISKKRHAIPAQTKGSYSYKDRCTIRPLKQKYPDASWTPSYSLFCYFPLASSM